MDCLFSLHENSVPWYLLGQAVGEPVYPGKIGRLHEGYAPYGIYEGKKWCGWYALLSDNRWEAMVRTMGKNICGCLMTRASKDVTARCMNPKVVNDALDEWVMEQDSVEEVERIFDEVGIPCMRARTIEELCDTDPQVKARDMMPLIDQPFIGPMKMYGSPLKMSATPACVRGYSPFLGDKHTGRYCLNYWL